MMAAEGIAQGSQFWLRYKTEIFQVWRVSALSVCVCVSKKQAVILGVFSILLLCLNFIAVFSTFLSHY